MIAFLLYAAPVAVVSGAVTAWRTGKSWGLARKPGSLGVVAGFTFPVVCIIAIKL